MKKYTLLIFFFFGSLCVMAQQEVDEAEENTNSFGLYKSKGLIDEPAPENPETPDAPIGDGLYVLLGAAGVYILSKRLKLV